MAITTPTTNPVTPPVRGEPTHAVEYDELDITTTKGLAAFLENAASVHGEAVAATRVAQDDHFQALAIDEVAGSEVYAVVHEKFERLRQAVTTLQRREGNDVTDAEVTTLQGLYDDLILLRNHIQSAYVSRQADTGSVSSKTPRHLDQIPTSSEEVATTTSDNQSTDTSVTNYKARVRDELAALLKQQGVKKIRQRLDRSFENADTKAIIDRQAELLRQEIQAVPKKEQEKKSPKTVTSTDDQIINTPSGVDSVMTQQSVDIKGAAFSEQALGVTIRKVRSNQFYTDQERARAERLHEAVQYSMAADVEPQQIQSHYQKLCDYVVQLNTQPERSVLKERADRIVEHIAAAAGESAAIVLQEATRRRDALDQQLGEPGSAADPVTSYKKLEQYAWAHERTWLRVFGLPVPPPGKEGLHSVQTLRERLIVLRDRHPLLKQQPLKQLFVDKLIRILANLSDSGLSFNADVPRVIELMRLIDLPHEPGAVAPAAALAKREEPDKTPLAVRTDVDDGEPTETLTWQTQKRKDLSVQYEASEGSVPIQTARSEVKSTETDSRAKTSTVTRGAEEVKTAPANPSPVQSGRGTVIHKRQPVTLRPFTQRVLKDKACADFVSQTYRSARAFEQAVLTVAADIERDTVDLFERWLQEERTSPFLFLQDQLVSEVLELAAAENIREELAKQNIKYETFVAWVDLLDEMWTDSVLANKTTFGELFARWLIRQQQV